MRIQELKIFFFTIAGWGKFTNFGENSRCRRIITKFYWGMGCLNSNKQFDFGTDPDHDPDPGILNGIFTTAG